MPMFLPIAVLLPTAAVVAAISIVLCVRELRSKAARARADFPGSTGVYDSHSLPLAVIRFQMGAFVC